MLGLSGVIIYDAPHGLILGGLLCRSRSEFAYDEVNLILHIALRDRGQRIPGDRDGL
jgi:hypothetical protein